MARDRIEFMSGMDTVEEVLEEDEGVSGGSPNHSRSLASLAHSQVIMSSVREEGRDMVVAERGVTWLIHSCPSCKLRLVSRANSCKHKRCCGKQSPKRKKGPTIVVHLNRTVAAFRVPWPGMKPSDANSGLDQTGSGANATNSHQVMRARGKCEAPCRDDNFVFDTTCPSIFTSV